MRISPTPRGRRRPALGDNKAANGAARKGFFGSTDLNLLAHKLKARSVVDRLMHEHGAVQVLFEWHSIFEGLSV